MIASELVTYNANAFTRQTRWCNGSTPVEIQQAARVRFPAVSVKSRQWLFFVIYIRHVHCTSIDAVGAHLHEKRGAGVRILAVSNFFVGICWLHEVNQIRGNKR